jgi:hypothetical protein
MPINPVRPPADIVNLAVRHVQTLALAPGPHLLSDVPQEELELAAPHRVYVLPFDAIRDKQLSRAVFAGWRFLVVAGDNVIASAEVLDDAEHSVAVNAGPFAAATAAAIDDLENLPQVQAGDVELRILKVSALYLVAAWLAGDQQMIIPLEPAPPFVQAGRVYTEQSFFEALSQPAVKPFSGGPGKTAN